jgi:hypothetical protein
MRIAVRLVLVFLEKRIAQEATAHPLKDRFQKEPYDENGQQGRDGFIDSQPRDRIASREVIDPLKQAVDGIHMAFIL